MFRLIKIITSLLKYRIYRWMPDRFSYIFYSLYLIFPWTLLHSKKKTKEQDLKECLEELGPIFIKLGQLISTRKDLISEELSKELQNLQDNVPPFSSAVAKNICEKNLKENFIQINNFSEIPLAAASIAQVHVAFLNEKKIILKIKRPKIENIFKRDLRLMRFFANLIALIDFDQRFKAVEVVNEFERIFFQELDFLQEAANASQLKRNFKNSNLLYVPNVYWNYCTKDVLAIEYIDAISVKKLIDEKPPNVDFKKLAENGVLIFFKQVFEDSFFHADMHPGNIFIDISNPEFPVYKAVDFGIVGSLTIQDQHYISSNLIAFFENDYKKIVQLHLQSGWVPHDVDELQFEADIRKVCEPLTNRSLKDISFGLTLLNLLNVAQKHKMIMQPQLLLLQKTLVSIEGLGRQFYPDLNLWDVGYPYLKRRFSFIKRFNHDAKKLLSLAPLLIDSISEIRGNKKSENKNNNFLIMILFLSISTNIMLILKNYF